MKTLNHRSELPVTLAGCRAVREIIDTSELAAQHPVPITAHLEKCPACQSYHHQLTGLRQLLAKEPRLEVPTDFDLKLRQRIAASQRQPLGLTWWQFIQQPATGIAGLLIAVILLAAVVYLRQNQIQKPDHLSFTTTSQQREASSMLPSQPIVSEAGGIVAQPVATEELPVVRSAKLSRDRLNPGTSMDARMVLENDADITIEVEIGTSKRNASVSQVVYGAQPVLDVGIVNTEKLEGVTLTQGESTIF
ncbi:MAG: hypothetical protein AB1489_10485 [Acidobacteriota bacterium]